MAITNIQGTVTRVFYSGKGAEVTEVSNSNGKEFKTRWSCWFDNEHGLSEGQPVKVSGFHGDKISDWTDKEGNQRHSVERSLNKARVQDQQVAPPKQPAVDQWAPSNEEMPF
jgi:hypothetical protein